MMQRDKLKTLPNSPGVYFHKDKFGEIIYVGKAAVLKNRVRQYFQNSKLMDKKTLALVSEIADTDWVETDSEIDALFLEAEMVKRYLPRYNILLRDDKSSIYIRIDMKNSWPCVTLVHLPIDDGAEYFGPYFNAYSIKKALRFLRRIFPYFVKPITNQLELNPEKFRRDLDSHIGLSPDGISSSDYKNNLKKLISYIKGDRKKIIKQLEIEMQLAANKNDFELAAQIRNKIFNLRDLGRQIVFGDKEFLDISKDQALMDLTELLNLTKIPVRIEGYDISHMSGTNVVASMVVFKNGVSDRASYRKFKIIHDKNDDFYNMNEALRRRFSEKNIKDWGLPNLVLVDGGKGQLDAALKIRSDLNLKSVFIGLAKRDEQIVISNALIKINHQKLANLSGSVEKTVGYSLINLPKDSPIIKLLQRIRDESHRFAISYHTILKRTKQNVSLLDEIPGIGPKTKTKLMKKYGSLSSIKKVSPQDLEKNYWKIQSKACV
jgi:excinuclease ABC subunit C